MKRQGQKENRKEDEGACNKEKGKKKQQEDDKEQSRKEGMK